MENIKTVISNRLKKLLAERNVKQKELAKHLNVTDNTVSYFVNGTRQPNIEQIIKISNFFNVSTDYILGNSEVETTDITIKEICDYTGLTESNVEKIKLADKNIKEIFCILTDNLLECPPACNILFKFINNGIFYEKIYDKAVISFIEKFLIEHNIEYTDDFVSDIFEAHDTKSLCEKLPLSEIPNFFAEFEKFNEKILYLYDLNDLSKFRLIEHEKKIFENVAYDICDLETNVYKNIMSVVKKTNYDDILENNIKNPDILDKSNEV